MTGEGTVRWVVMVDFRSAMPWPVVAEMWRSFGSPKWRNSVSERVSRRSDLLRTMR